MAILENVADYEEAVERFRDGIRKALLPIGLFVSNVKSEQGGYYMISAHAFDLNHYDLDKLKADGILDCLDEKTLQRLMK